MRREEESEREQVPSIINHEGNDLKILPTGVELLLESPIMSVRRLPQEFSKLAKRRMEGDGILVQLGARRKF